jgi:hypothetical protein
MSDKRITAADVAKEVADLRSRVETIEKAAEAMKTVAEQTNRRVLELHDALMTPEPGQEFGLLHRTAKVATAIESGERVAGWAVKIASVLAAIGVIAASIKVGIWPGVK